MVTPVMINLNNRNSSFRKQIFDVAASSFRELLDDYPNDDHYKNFTRDREFLVNLEPSTQLYGLLLPGTCRTSPKFTTSLFSLLLAGQLVPEASGVGYKQHYCRAATQSIFENLAYFSNGICTGPNSVVGTMFVEDVRSSLCCKLESNLLDEIVERQLRIHSTHLKDITRMDLYSVTSNNAAAAATLEVFRRAMVFFKNSVKWMANDYPISIGDFRVREHYSNLMHTASDDISDDNNDESCKNFFPEKIFEGCKANIGIRLRTICNSVRLWMLNTDGARSSYHYPEYYYYHRDDKYSTSTSRLNVNKKDVKALVIAFLLAPGLFLDELCVGGEFISNFRSRVAHNMDETDMYAKFAIIDTDSKRFFNPVSQSICHVESNLIRYNAHEVVEITESQHSDILGQNGHYIQKTINKIYYPGYFRSLSHPKVLDACKAIASAEKVDYKMFKEYWEKLQKEEDLHFDLNYKKSRG